MKIKLEEDKNDCMLKCNFCADSSSKGKCRYVAEGVRSEHCEKAIRNMKMIIGGKTE